MNSKMNKEYYIRVLIATVAVAGLVYAASQRTANGTPIAAADTAISSPEKYFGRLDIKAKSAVVVDVQTGKILFGREAESQLPLASITKVMTALAAYDALPENTEIEIAPEDAKVESGSGLAVGEKWKLGDLMRYMLVVSSNDGASAIARTVGDGDKSRFVDLMNKKAQELGLTETYFMNESGLDFSGQVGGAYGSALDIARLFVYALSHAPDIMQSTRYDKIKFFDLDNKSYVAKNTDLIVASLPNAMASKTGSTDLAGGNLAVIFDAGLGRPVVIVVLGSTDNERFSDVEKLAGASLSYFGAGI
jgi:D-alanyl-D-alanine carboxypeptidase (penicillin-binding protein 5/6)